MVAGAQVEVDAVLALLGVRRPLQEYLDAGPVGGHQSLVDVFRALAGGWLPSNPRGMPGPATGSHRPL
jgi:hypothetical protein